MQLDTLALILSILTPLFAFISFGIKASTGSPLEEWIYKLIHRRQKKIHHPMSPPLQPPHHTFSPAKTDSPAVSTRQPSIRRSWQDWIPHPWLLGMTLFGFLIMILFLSIYQSGNASHALALGLLGIVGILLYTVSWISSIVIAAKGRHWVWFTVLILTAGYAVIFFSIFVDRPQKPAPASMKGTGGSPAKPAGI